MMKRIFLIFVFVLVTSSGWAQETNRNQFSNTPESARFEIVQSQLAARFTFKIDKYTGVTFQLVEGENGLTWQAMETERQTHDETHINKVINNDIMGVSILRNSTLFLLFFSKGGTMLRNT